MEYSLAMTNSLLWEMAPGIDDEYYDLPMINMVVLHFATLNCQMLHPLTKHGGPLGNPRISHGDL